MKKKIIFLALTLFSVYLKAQISVDNAGVSVDKEYHHQLSCTANTESENFSVLVKWKRLNVYDPDGRAPYKKNSFAYEINNLNTKEVWKDSYADFIYKNAYIVNTDLALKFDGVFFMYKRLGTISKTASIDFERQNSQLLLKNIKLKAGETFQNPKDYCNPPTRLCGSKPIYTAPVILDVVFENSSCEYSEIN